MKELNKATRIFGLSLILLINLTVANTNDGINKEVNTLTNGTSSEEIAQLPAIDLISGGSYDKNKLSSPNRYKMAQDGDNLYIAFPRSNCSNNGGVPSVLHLQKDTKNLTALDGVDCIKPTPGASNVPDEYIADDLQIAINPKTKQPVIAFVSRRSNNSLVVLEHVCTAGSCQWYQLDAKDQKNNPLPTNIGHLSLAVDTDGNPLVAYQNTTFGPQGQGKSQISVIKITMEFNTTKYTWNFVGNANFSGISRGYIYLALDWGNQPFVAYLDWNYAPQVAYLPYAKDNWVALPMPADEWQKEDDSTIDFALIHNNPLILYRADKDRIVNFKEYIMAERKWEQIWNKAAYDSHTEASVKGQALTIKDDRIIVAVSDVNKYDHDTVNYNFGITDHPIDNIGNSNYVFPTHTVTDPILNAIMASDNGPEFYVIAKTDHDRSSLFVNNL